MMQELRRSYHARLAALRDEVADLMRVVMCGIEPSAMALLEQNLTLAETLIRNADLIDSRIVAIEQECYTILALQAPVAGDLREIAGALKIADDISRASQLVVSVCKGARRLHGHSLPTMLCCLLDVMAQQTGSTFGMALDAYVELDGRKADALDAADSERDLVQQQLIAEIFDGHANGRCQVAEAIQVAAVARSFERINDHAVNIGESVLYIATGWSQIEIAGRLRLRRHRPSPFDLRGMYGRLRS